MVLGPDLLPAYALWSADGLGPAATVASWVDTPAAPVASLSSDDVSLTWPATTMAGGGAVESYSVRRISNLGVAEVVTGGCAGSIVGLACTEANVPAGLWRYTVTAHRAGWRSLEGPTSAVVTVLAPTLVLSSPTTTTVPRTFTGTIANLAPGSALTFRLDSPTGPVLAGTPAAVPVSGGGAVSVTVPTGVSDTTHLVYAVDGTGSSASASFSYVDSPTLSSLQMFDSDGDGKVDQVVATFDEALDPAAVTTAGWTLTSAPSGATLASVAVSGSTATLTLTEGTGAANTAVGSFRVALAANANAIRDLNGNQASFTATAPTDRAAPAPVTVTMQDTNTNGKVDRVRMVFSESLATYSAGVAPWTLAGVPSNGTLASVSVSGTTATATITEGSGARDTAVGSFTVALAASATGVRDALGNQSRFAATTPLDGAKPVAVSVADTNGATDGLLEVGDTVSVTFSEVLASASVPATVTVTETGPASGNDTLTISGITSGARSLGSSSYVTAAGVSAAFASSTTALAGGGATVTVTVGGACAGTGCVSLGAGGPSTLAFAPSTTTLADAAGNLAAGSLNVTALRLF